MKDYWVWRIHSLNCYNVSSVYHFLRKMEDVQMFAGSRVWWSKVVPLKVNLFIWWLFCNRLPNKDNLVRRNILLVENQICSNDCTHTENRDHIFASCPHFGRVLSMLAEWLGSLSAF